MIVGSTITAVLRRKMWCRRAANGQLTNAERTTAATTTVQKGSQKGRRRAALCAAGRARSLHWHARCLLRPTFCARRSVLATTWRPMNGDRALHEFLAPCSRWKTRPGAQSGLSMPKHADNSKCRPVEDLRNEDEPKSVGFNAAATAWAAGFSSQIH
jgi:hypothetical protein